MIASKVRPGQLFDRRFLLTEAIGRGGMSTIYKARDQLCDGALVVVKVPLPEFSSGVGAWSMFQREEEIGSRLDHPFVLKYLPADAGRPRSYVVTEYVLGRTLAAKMAERRPLPELEAFSIASRICAALDHMHGRGFVHYDLKPANVMVCPDDSIRVIDLGLAHAAVTTRFAMTGRLPAIGSAEYLAPEQVKRKRGRTSVDIYALGAMLYEMLTGRPPFPGDDPFVVASRRVLSDPPAPRTLNPRISKEAEEIILRAMQRDSRRRYPSARAMKADLDRPEGVTVVGLSEQLVPMTRWRAALRIARHVAVVLVLPLAAQMVLFFLLWSYFAHR